MKRLFKEIFRSIKHSKVVVIGISVLVFLSSLIFTLFWDVRNAYQSQLDSYTNVSRLQDLTVDLSVESAGRTPSQGTFNESVTTYTLTNPSAETNFLDFSGDYILATELFPAAPANKYINATVFKDLYNSVANTEQISINYTDNQIIISDLGYSIALYNKVGEQYVRETINNTINSSDVFTFDKETNLNLVSRINTGQNNVAFLSNLGSLFLNVVTKEATTDTAKAHQWESRGELYVIDSQNLARLLGFSEREANSGYYFLDTNITPQIKLTPAVQVETNRTTISFATKMSGSFSLSYLGNAVIDHTSNRYYEILHGSYGISLENIKKMRSEQRFLQHNYKLNYDPNDTTGWSGNYLQAIESLLQNEDQKKLIESFHYWEKVQVIYLNGVLSSTNKVVLTRQDLQSSIVNPNQNQTSIAEIEHINDPLNLDAKEFSELVNVDIANQRLAIIVDLSKTITKKALIDEVIKKVGVENVGIRQTISHTDIDKEKNKSVSYAFVNTGDKNFTVEGVNQNVGRLYNEYFNPTKLNTEFTQDDLFFKSDELDSNISASLTRRVLDNYYLDPNYLVTTVLYEPVLRENTDGTVSTLPNQKIVVTKEQQTTSLQNQGVISDKDKFYAVVKEDNNWIIRPQEAMDLQALTSFFINNKLTIDSKTINGAWARTDPDNSYRITLPLVARVPYPEVLNEILTTGNFATIANNVTQTIRNSALYENGFFTEQFLEIFINSASVAAKANQIEKLLSVGRANANVFPKFYIDIIYYMNQNYGSHTFQNFVNNILSRMKAMIQAQGGLEAQKQYFQTQIESLLGVFKSFGSDLLSILPLNITIEDILNYTIDPVGMIDGLITIVNGFDVDSAIAEIRNWYSENWQKTVDGKQNLISDFNMLVPFFRNANQNEIKNGLISIVNNIDFNKIFNPELDSSIYSKLSVDKPNLVNLRTVFKNVNAGNNYKNVSEGLIELINIFNLDVFISELESRAKWVDHFQEDDETPYRYFGVKTTDVLSSFIVAATKISSDLTVSNNDILVKNAIIKLLNLSDAGEFNDLAGYLPLFKNDNKLGLASLSALTELQVSTNDLLAELNLISAKTLTSTLTNADIQTLKSQFPFITNFTRENYEEIRSYISSYNALISLYAFDNNFINFASLTNILLSSEPDNEVYKQARNQVLQANPVNATNPDGSINYGYGESFVDLFKFLVYLKLKAKDAETYESDYNKLIALFKNATKNNNTITFSSSFLNTINSKDLYNDIAQNINLGGFNISLALAANRKVTQSLFDASNPDQSLMNFLDSLSEESKKTIIENQQSFVSMLALLASLLEYNPNAFEIFTSSSRRSFLSIINGQNSIFNRDEKLKEILTFNIENSIKTSNLLDRINITSFLLNSLGTTVLPQAVIWFTSDSKISKDTTLEERKNRANLAYLLNDKIIKFNELTNEELDLITSMIFPAEMMSSPAETNAVTTILMDIDYFNKIGISAEGAASDENKFFGLNVKEFIFNALNTITYEQRNNSLIVFEDPSSYLAKVNFAYLKNNNLAVYEGDIPTDALTFQAWLNANEKANWILNVGGSKFVIIGTETTSDFIYPVIDESNIQVDTSTQAVVYLNQKGFDRVKSFASGTVKTFMLVKNETAKTDQQIVDEINQYTRSSQQGDGTTIQKSYLANQVDPLNPERSLRIRAPRAIIRAINNFNLYSLIILIVLVSIVFIFVIRRYIQKKSTVLGILISQGYTPMQISLSLTTFALITAVVGGVLGYITGHFLQSYVIQLFSNYWSIPTTLQTFNFGSFILTIILPILAMSAFIILIALWQLRTKSIDLMSGISEVKINSLTNWFYVRFRKRNIKTKYNISLLMNSFFKLFWLTISFILTSVVIMISISSSNVFSRAASKTYEDRHYNYKVDLTSPTTEGGLINQANANSLENSLYMPIGYAGEANLEYNDYFAPGYSIAVNGELNPNGTINALNNGVPTIANSKIVTKYGASVAVNIGLKVNPWELTYNVLPDTQKTRIDEITQKIGPLLSQTQWDDESTIKLIVDENNRSYFGSIERPLNYFNYYSNLNGANGIFYERWNALEKRYIPESITSDSTYIDSENVTHKVRDLYRQFLISGYQKLFRNQNLSDYLIIFQGVLFDDRFDETFTYVSSNLEGSAIKINGYKPNSTYLTIKDEYGNNLMDNVVNFKTDEENVYPVIVNVVSAARFHLGVGSTFDAHITNHSQRFISQIKNQNINTNVKFRVVGINATYINDEFVTSQEIANKLIGIDSTPMQQAFNGILSKRENPDQVTASSSLYSNSGYMPALTGFNFDNQNQVFDYIFGNNGTLQSKGVTESEIIRWLDLDNVNSLAEIKTNPNNISLALNKYATLYENSLYSTLVTYINSKDIESGFTGNLTSLINNVLNNVIIASILISVIILIIITNIMISENERNIALFSILGYNTREKIRLFFAIFAPVIGIAITVATFISIGAIAIFNRILISSSSLALPINIVWWHILLTMVAIILILLVMSTLSWIWINKIKPIMIMKRA
ncbi:ABC transporter permease [Mycoplasmopsis agassizii]|uniref:ABC transporter permease n=1 Tax=Mycoplasmopsis agassizii TaxID=33922 RepID=A0ABX4H4P8_9BACT|nr:ABC transporter permease [Mycoplasmopsis agassizii]PAF54860.1 ABC transporter permease [Mycoplasmopsis agassizii]SMC18561.1 putative ABC transport system permease protein [Mycoplasmopsis agassizii]